MRLRRGVIQFVLGAMLSALNVPAEAHQPTKVPRIGYVSAALALKNQLPSMYEGHTRVEAAGLMSYSANDMDLFRRPAVYVDRY